MKYVSVHLQELVEIIDKEWVVTRSGNSRKADSMAKNVCAEKIDY
ncbi:MAG: hypothetical protein ACMV1B_03110 [Prevotella sp.]